MCWLCLAAYIIVFSVLMPACGHHSTLSSTLTPSIDDFTSSHSEWSTSLIEVENCIRSGLSSCRMSCKSIAQILKSATESRYHSHPYHLPMEVMKLELLRSQRVYIIGKVIEVQKDELKSIEVTLADESGVLTNVTFPRAVSHSPRQIHIH